MPVIPLILTYWRQILMGIGVLVLTASIFYVKHIFNQNTERGMAIKLKDAQIENLKAGFESYLKFNTEVADATAKVRKESQINVTWIENSPIPVNGSKFVFMSASSVRTQTYPTYSRYSGAAAGNR